MLGRGSETVGSPRALNILIPFSCPSRGHIYRRKQRPGPNVHMNFLVPLLAWREQAREAKNKMRRSAHEVSR